MSHVLYSNAVGILMYAMVYNRSYISHAVGVLSKYMSKPRKDHWTTVNRVLKYLCFPNSYGLCYQGRPGLDKVLDIHGFVDVDSVGYLDNKRSTSMCPVWRSNQLGEKNIVCSGTLNYRS